MCKYWSVKAIPGILVAFFLISTITLPVGCSRSEFDGMREGKIVYDVVIEGEDINPMMQAMMPSEVTCYFGNNKTCMVISAAMNMMETKLISDAENFKYTTLVSAMGRKIAMVLDKDQVKENYSDRVNLKVVHTNEVKEIAGISCRQVMVTDSTQNTYPVYYTNELAIDDPNWSSPFRDIDGMLMEYSIRFGGMVMNLKAKKIENVQHDPSMFEIPEGYEIITDPNEMRFGF